MRANTVNVLRWSERADPGETVVYFRGHNVADTPVQKPALEASERGLVFLAARRQSGGEYIYQATRISQETAKRLDRISRSVEQSMDTLKRNGR